MQKRVLADFWVNFVGKSGLRDCMPDQGIGELV